MPSRTKLSANGQGEPRNVSRKRYDDVETQRTALLDRLSCLGGQESANPGYKNAQTLLNERFRLARIDQRIEILKAADWLIRLLENHKFDGGGD